MIWTIILPVAAFGAFLWDGIYIGATASKAMRNAMLISVLCVFVPVYIISYPIIGNHGLWLSLILFMLSRGILLQILAKNAIFKAIH